MTTFPIPLSSSSEAKVDVALNDEGLAGASSALKTCHPELHSRP